jgi:hypothetical protein
MLPCNPRRRYRRGTEVLTVPDYDWYSNRYM